MNTPSTPELPPDGAQHQRFREAARVLECDDDAGRFNARLKKVTKAPPKPDGKTPPKDD